MSDLSFHGLSSHQPTFVAHTDRTASDGTMNMAELQLNPPRAQISNKIKIVDHQQESRLVASESSQIFLPASETMNKILNFKSSYHMQLTDCRKLLKLSLKVSNLSSSKAGQELTAVLSKARERVA